LPGEPWLWEAEEEEEKEEEKEENEEKDEGVYVSSISTDGGRRKKML
jgi:hypothetical protein